MKTKSLTLFIIVLLAVASAMPLLASAEEQPVQCVILELLEKTQETVTPNEIPPNDNSMQNGHFELTGYFYTGYALQDVTTAPYYINTKNKYGFSASAIVEKITLSATAWDDQTSKAVFSYLGTTDRSALKRDQYNVIDWGIYRRGVIAVTMYWISGSKMMEIDMRMNTLYKWSLSGEARKMDVQNIATHEFGHWVGLADLYDDPDYWLTMYGYSGYGITYQQTIGLGDKLGLQAVYGQ
jgi:hypothetical protein